MGPQVELFADTIIATFLPAGALSALYYADRLNQLPIGVIVIAIGTVLLPEMPRRIASGDQAAASVSQRHAFDFTLLLSVPLVAAFVMVPDAMLRAFAKCALTGVILGAALWYAARLAAVHLAQISAFRDEPALLLLVVVGAFVYAGSILTLFGRRWLVSLVR